jgi:hypothetical protein
MRKLIWSFIKRVARSRAGHLLAILSLCFVLIAFYPLPLNHPQFVSCVPTKEEIYTITEVLKHPPVWVFVIGITYFPSMLLTKFLTGAVSSVFSLSCYPTAKIELLIFLICSSVQWMLVGCGIEWLIRRWRTS